MEGLDCWQEEEGSFVCRLSFIVVWEKFVVGRLAPLVDDVLGFSSFEGCLDALEDRRNIYFDPA